MAAQTFIGVNGAPRKLKKCYVGVGGVPRNVKAIYVGVGGVPRLAWQDLPSIFGTGADGVLYIAAGQTVVLPVPSPHISVVEKNYTSITIEAGGVLKCSDPNAGLVLRCRNSCIINGTIDQSAKAPVTNPGNSYPYPAELACGNGGTGGRGGGKYDRDFDGGYGGAGQAARKYGGGYSGGGGGGGGTVDDNYDHGEPDILYYGGNGGSGDIYLQTPLPALFVGGTGSYGAWGVNGGGGAGNRWGGKAGGTGAGADGETSPNPDGLLMGGGGGAGNCGGGVALIYCGGNLNVAGSILCSGGKGGNGSKGGSDWGRGHGAGGGGAGGGAIYICYNSGYSVTGALNVNGGAGGLGLTGSSSAGGENSQPGTAGTIGTVTAKKYVEGMI